MQTSEKKGINSSAFEEWGNKKQVIPRRGKLFQFREDYLTCVGIACIPSHPPAKLKYYEENDPEKFEMIKMFGKALIAATSDGNFKVVRQIIKANM